MKKIHLKKHKKINIIFIIIILIIISVFYIIKLLDTKSNKYIKEYTEIEVEKVITKIINSGVNKAISESELIDQLLELENNNISISSKNVNKLIYETASIVKSNLKEVEEGKEYIIVNIPSGVIINNIILSNLFPKIPIKVYVLGDLVCKLDTDLKEYGINNALINLNINVSISVKILYPFNSEKKTITVSIPILTKILEGSVPSYYFKSN